jgi:hypothetical protein
LLQPAKSWLLCYEGQIGFVCHLQLISMSIIRSSGNMTLAAVLQHRTGRWLLGFLFWTVLGLSFASQFYISNSKAGYDVTWKQAVSFSLGDWYVFALLSIPVNALARRFRFDTGTWGKSLPVHILGSVAFSLSYMILRASLGSWQSGFSFAEAFKPLLVKTLALQHISLWRNCGCQPGLRLLPEISRARTARLGIGKAPGSSQTSSAPNAAQPAFLFNTLHSISSLMHKDVEAADRMIMRLSDLLRAALSSADTQEVSLRKELELLQLYLGIEQIRFGDRLSVQINVADEALDAQVPNLILQTAGGKRHPTWHRAPRAAWKDRTARLPPGRRAIAGGLSINGKGIPDTKPAREGVGLSNTRERLRELYGEAHRFELRPGRRGRSAR